MYVDKILVNIRILQNSLEYQAAINQVLKNTQQEKNVTYNKHWMSDVQYAGCVYNTHTHTTLYIF